MLSLLDSDDELESTESMNAADGPPVFVILFQMFLWGVLPMAVRVLLEPLCLRRLRRDEQQNSRECRKPLRNLEMAHRPKTTASRQLRNWRPVG